MAFSLRHALHNEYSAGETRKLMARLAYEAELRRAQRASERMIIALVLIGIGVYCMGAALDMWSLPSLSWFTSGWSW